MSKEVNPVESIYARLEVHEMSDYDCLPIGFLLSDIELELLADHEQNVFAQRIRDGDQNPRQGFYTSPGYEYLGDQL